MSLVVVEAEEHMVVLLPLEVVVAEASYIQPLQLLLLSVIQ
jgi:hypothetical protein